MKIIHKNLPRLVEVAEYWKRNGSNITLPQHYVPNGVDAGSVEHKIFLFVLCFLTPRSHSSVLIKKTNMLLQRGVEVEDLFHVLSSERHIPLFKKQIEWMSRCKESLGGLRNISSFDEKWQSVNDFLKDRGSKYPGWGPKLYSLYRMALEETAKISAPDDAFPIDGHAISRFTTFGIFQMEGGNRCIKTVERYLRPEITDFLKDNNLRAWEVHNPIWYLGATHCRDCINENRGCALDFCSSGSNNQDYWSGILRAKN